MNEETPTEKAPQEEKIGEVVINFENNNFLNATMRIDPEIMRRIHE